MATTIKKAVIFDLDGTLAPTMEVIRIFFQQRMQEASGRVITHNELTQAYHYDFKTFMRNLNILDDKLVNTLETEIRDLEARQKDALFFDGIAQIITELHEQEFDLYLWTLRLEKSALEILKFNGVIQYFLDFHCGDHECPKPNPTGIKEKLIHNYQTIYMVGDTVADMRGGKNLGAINIGATWAKTNPPEMLKTDGADFLVDDISKLRQIFK